MHFLPWHAGNLIRGLVESEKELLKRMERERDIARENARPSNSAAAPQVVRFPLIGAVSVPSLGRKYF